jgi:hypothetical protein
MEGGTQKDHGAGADLASGYQSSCQTRQLTPEGGGHSK